MERDPSTQQVNAGPPPPVEPEAERALEEPHRAPDHRVLERIMEHTVILRPHRRTHPERSPAQSRAVGHIQQLLRARR